MPDSEVNCRKIRARLSAEWITHAAQCDDCLEALMEVGLRQPPAVAAPPDFARRVLALVPARDRSVLPWAIAAACVLFGFLSARIVLETTGVEQLAAALGSLKVLAPLAAVEACVTAAWLWRLAHD